MAGAPVIADLIELGCRRFRALLGGLGIPRRLRGDGLGGVPGGPDPRLLMVMRYLEQ